MTADAADGERLGLASLRLRRLPPREALWPREGEDDHGDGHDYRYAAYITGLAVAKSARRRGVASTLVDYAERKGAPGARRPLPPRQPPKHAGAAALRPARLFRRAGLVRLQQPAVPALQAAERRGAGDAASRRSGAERAVAAPEGDPRRRRDGAAGVVEEGRRPRLRTRGGVRHRVPD